MAKVLKPIAPETIMAYLLPIRLIILEFTAVKAYLIKGTTL